MLLAENCNSFKFIKVLLIITVGFFLWTSCALYKNKRYDTIGCQSVTINLHSAMHIASESEVHGGVESNPLHKVRVLFASTSLTVQLGSGSVCETIRVRSIWFVWLKYGL